MSYLILFFLLSVGISFLCSILESVLLSVQMSYISVLEKEKPHAGKLLRSHKENINKSIASILIINTIANTLGAAVVGSQASKVFEGDSAMVYVSVILTFSILFFSEIIPKTIGAIYWKALAPVAGRFIQSFIWITYPIIFVTMLVTDKISKGRQDRAKTTKDELLESMFISEDEGVIDEQESDFIENILKLDKKRISEILTPRSVIFAIEGHITIKEVMETQPDIFKFSRIPLYNGTIEDITGIVLTKKIFKQSLKDDSVAISTIQDRMHSIHENLSVAIALNIFIKKKQHMFLVKDSYGQTEGILTLEDCVETILGIEIMDESDTIEDMRVLAKLKMKKKQREDKLREQKLNSKNSNVKTSQFN
jgi:CBS domain containing-hemolysin-like protein